jgi:hypothetical protein
VRLVHLAHDCNIQSLLKKGGSMLKKGGSVDDGFASSREGLDKAALGILLLLVVDDISVANLKTKQEIIQPALVEPSQIYCVGPKRGRPSVVSQHIHSHSLRGTRIRQ